MWYDRGITCDVTDKLGRFSFDDNLERTPSYVQNVG